MLDTVRYKDVRTVTGAKGSSALFTTSLAGGADKNNTNSYSGLRHLWNICSTYIMKQISIMNRGYIDIDIDVDLFAERAVQAFHHTPGLEITVTVCCSRLACLLLLPKAGTSTRDN